jgi:NADPH:quinone reductase-like Zn-dependent oxidoreductase
MRAVVITEHGAPEVLQIREVPAPMPKPGDVRIRVEAAGVNFADISARVGLYPDAPPPPCVVGYEVAGTIEALGDGVTSFAVGDPVLAMTMFGGYGSLVCTDARAAVRRPESMSVAEAAAFPVVYLTAYHMLSYMQRLHPGDRVLIHAAAGGVGIAAVQLCKHAGVEIFATASASKHAFLQSLGVQHTIDYRTQDFAEEVRKLTGGDGVDVVLDALGGKALAKSYDLLRPAGRLVTYGFSAAVQDKRRSLVNAAMEYLRMPRFKWMDLMNNNVAVIGVNMAHMSKRPDVISQEFAAILEMYGQGVLKPHVDKTFPAERAAEAHHYIQDRKNVGKVVLTFGD